MRRSQRGFDLVVGDDTALFKIDQQHLARLQTPFRDDLFLRNGQNAHFGGHHHKSVLGDEIARGAQSVAIQRRADLAAIGEGHSRRTVPRLHQRRMIFVKGLAMLVHERIARPGLGNKHHHGMSERIAPAHQKFQRIVETGGVRLALIGDRPELADVRAEQRRGDGRLTRRHPVQIPAQRVDLAVVRDEAVGVRETP